MDEVVTEFIEAKTEDVVDKIEEIEIVEDKPEDQIEVCQEENPENYAEIEAIVDAAEEVGVVEDIEEKLEDGSNVDEIKLEDATEAEIETEVIENEEDNFDNQEELREEIDEELDQQAIEEIEAALEEDCEVDRRRLQALREAFSTDEDIPEIVTEDQSEEVQNDEDIEEPVAKIKDNKEEAEVENEVESEDHEITSEDLKVDEKFASTSKLSSVGADSGRDSFSPSGSLQYTESESDEKAAFYDLEEETEEVVKQRIDLISLLTTSGAKYTAIFKNGLLSGTFYQLISVYYKFSVGRSL